MGTGVDTGFHPDASPADLGFWLRGGDVRSCSVIELPARHQRNRAAQISVTVGARHPGGQEQLAANGLDATATAAATACSAV